MLNRFKMLMQSFADTTDNQESKQARLNLAAAVLLVEVMMADHEVRAEELEQISIVLEKLFDIEKSESAPLIEDARQRHKDLVSLYDMTSIINEEHDQELKRKLVYAMWCIALADDEKDKYEEHLIRKVADLLYLSHSDFIKARHNAEHRCAGAGSFRK
jgi:uncharacterized tellurite resistance protein B-like protein